jgi:hypothetical protein
MTREWPRSGDIHVMPIGDTVEHMESRDCPCRPTPDPATPSVLVHHSADGREHVETRKPS